ncbi:MAG: hypothetical protein WCV72_05310 [Patescibacteria group bacterium]
MGKIKSKIHRFFSRNLHHFQETLFALTLVFVIGGFVFANLGEGSAQLKAFLLNDKTISAELLTANSSLTLDPTDAPNSILTLDTNAWTNNQALINNLFKDSLIKKILSIMSYIMAGVFGIFLSLYVINFLTAGDKQDASKKFSERMLWAFVGFMILAIAKPLSDAFMLLRGDKIDLLTNPDTIFLSAKIVGFTLRSAAHLIEYILGGVALVTMGVAVFKMVGGVDSEETVKNARKTIAWGAIALFIVGASAVLVDKVFAPTDTVEAQIGSGALAVNQLQAILESGQSQARIVALNYVKYFQTFIGATAVLMLFLAGFKMVAAGGNEEIITRQRKMITWIFMGLSTVLISETFVNIFMPDRGGKIIFNSMTAIGSFSKQLGGFTNFILTFSSALAVLALIVGALYISTAFANPEQVEKGKKILLAACLGLVVTISAYALVNTVLTSGEKSTSISVSI